MFSVGASPFNSRKRAVYGGWTPNSLPDTNAYERAWDGSALDYVRDVKWADLAQKYAYLPAELDRATLIRDAAKGVLKLKRDAAKSGDRDAVIWMDGYKKAMKNLRSPYTASRLSYANRDSIWSAFQKLPWDDKFTDSQRLWLAMAKNAPYGAAPGLPAGTNFGTLPGVNTFVTQRSYSRPAKLASDTRKLLALARRGLVSEIDPLASVGLTAPSTPAPSPGVTVVNTPAGPVAVETPTQGTSGMTDDR